MFLIIMLFKKYRPSDIRSLVHGSPREVSIVSLVWELYSVEQLSIIFVGLVVMNLKMKRIRDVCFRWLVI